MAPMDPLRWSHHRSLQRLGGSSHRSVGQIGWMGPPNRLISGFIHPTYPKNHQGELSYKNNSWDDHQVSCCVFFCIQQLLDGLLIHHLYWFVWQSKTWKYFESRQLRFRAAFPTKSTIRHLSPITNRRKKNNHWGWSGWTCVNRHFTKWAPYCRLECGARAELLPTT
jgi:hypothetical protein